jgi:pyruvate dehydrogenase E2 component (dihydrolipoamide acetyltransferase)
MTEQEFRLPKFGMQMTDATLNEWLIADGAFVEKGQEIATISTDKVDGALEAPTSGRIKILVAAGETVEVGTLIATFS